MSFLGDIVSSIGGEKAPAPPIRPPSRPSSTKPQPATSSSNHNSPAVKPVYKGTANTTLLHPHNGLKRKADEAPSNSPNKSSRTTPQSGVESDSDVRVPLKGVSASNERSTSGLSSAPNQPASQPPAKLAAKGSYAAMLAKAKEAQQQKIPSQIGVIKHQPTEKVKQSKVAGRMREEQDKPRLDKSKQVPRPGSSGRLGSRPRSKSPAKNIEQTKVAKSSRPPLHGPTPQYKGTMGTAPKKSRDDRAKKNHYDDYLGTDEEDEGDDDGYGGGGEDYYSDASSDMEGGFDDLEAEETRALRAAREDDARELALEQRLKKEKLERKLKLEAMASKRK